MTTIDHEHVLLWCVGLNYLVLFIWFAVFVFAHDWMFRMHGRWFKLSVETFDAIHYAGLSVYKIPVILLNLVPLVALTFGFLTALLVSPNQRFIRGA